MGPYSYLCSMHHLHKKSYSPFFFVVQVEWCTTTNFIHIRVPDDAGQHTYRTNLSVVWQDGRTHGLRMHHWRYLHQPIRHLLRSARGTQNDCICNCTNIWKYKNNNWLLWNPHHNQWDHVRTCSRPCFPTYGTNTMCTFSPWLYIIHYLYII